MANFDLFAPLLKQFEGGFANDKDDPGKETYMGVTIATFRRFFGKNQTVEDLKRMTENQWRIIMLSYWDKVQGNYIIKQGVAEMFADWYINAGTNAIKAAQRALGTPADGIVGPKTISLLNRNNAFDVIQMARINYYIEIVKAAPYKIKFLKSWITRTIKIKNR